MKEKITQKCSNNQKCLKFKTVDNVLYKKEITTKKHWWFVNNGIGWYAISGEPSERLIPLN